MPTFDIFMRLFGVLTANFCIIYENTKFNMIFIFAVLLITIRLILFNSSALAYCCPQLQNPYLDASLKRLLQTSETVLKLF